MKKSLKPILFFILSFLIGGTGRRVLARWLLSAKVDPTANLGICFIDTKTLHMGPRSRLGHFNIIRNIEHLVLEDDAILGTFNWVFGANGTPHFQQEKSRKSALFLRQGSSVTSRHILDCTDTIDIGRFATVAGYRSQFLTHSIDITHNRQSCAPITIGEHSFIGTGTILLKGSVFPAASVLAAGSVYSKRDQPDFTLYSGVPALPVKDLPKTAKYLVRTEPHVA